jgi:hypothetical protein
VEAENALFSDKEDSMVNWDSSSLNEAFEANGLFDIKKMELVFNSMRRVSPGDIEYWIRESGDGERKSLGYHLRSTFSEEEFEEVKKLLHLQLDNADVTWRTVVIFFVIEKRI